MKAKITDGLGTVQCLFKCLPAGSRHANVLRARRVFAPGGLNGTLTRHVNRSIVFDAQPTTLL
jgi:hypothetical protein